MQDGQAYLTHASRGSTASQPFRPAPPAPKLTTLLQPPYTSKRPNSASGFRLFFKDDEAALTETPTARPAFNDLVRIVPSAFHTVFSHRRIFKRYAISLTAKEVFGENCGNGNPTAEPVEAPAAVSAKRATQRNSIAEKISHFKRCKEVRSVTAGFADEETGKVAID